MVGFLLGPGSGSFDVETILAPTDGMGDVEMWVGNIHDATSCWKVITSVEVKRHW